MLLLTINEAYTQSEPKTEKHHYGYGYNTIYETKLFDTAEIRARHFKIAYLIYHPCNWGAGKSNSSDTLLIYHFDTFGLEQEHSYIDTIGKMTTWFLDKRGSVKRALCLNINGDTLQDDTAKDVVDTVKRKESYSRIKDGLDSVFTTLILEEVVSGFDTLYYMKTVVGENEKVKEYLVITSKSIARQHHLMPTKTHYKYEYDDKGRLVTKKDLVSFKTYKTSYFDETIASRRTYPPAQGEVYETVDATSNRILNAEIKFKDEDDVITLTTKQKHVIITPLEKGSRLVKLLTVIVTKELPTVEYYEVSYK